MDIDNYILDRLKNISNTEITDDEKKMISLGQMELFISRRILSKKFRKNFLKEETKKLIQEKISTSVKENKPIYLIFAFGGYKNHWVEEFHPKAEWAELFHLIYICSLLSPIAKAYKPGIFLEYESECEAVIYHNNQTKEEIDQYTSTFKSLIEYIKPYVPSNLTFNYLTLPQQYNTDEFFKKVVEMVPEKTEELRKSLGDKLEESLKRPLFNLKIKGMEDLSSKTKEELNEIALKSLAFNHLFLDEDYKIRSNYFNGDERIAMVGAYCSEEENLDNWISINSCARSDNAFWTSRGILINTPEGIKEDIVGPKIYSDLKKNVTWKSVSIFKDSLSYLNTIPVVN